jgi:uncharacterized protein YndB with AHSA1/START domain
VSDPSATVVRLSRVFAAGRERVYSAWTNPDEFKQWLGSPEPITVRSAELDVREGGDYRIAFGGEDTSLLYLVGTYVEVTPPERLVFTWLWEGLDVEAGETLVTIDFIDRGDMTEVVLSHERNPSLWFRDFHSMGWTLSLDRLEKFISS